MRISFAFQRGLLAFALAAALPLAHADNTPMVLVDSVTDLKIDLGWDGSGTSYLGQHWNVWFSETWNESSQLWNVAVSYQHKDGPHGEMAEATIHMLPAATLAAGGSSYSGAIEDHRPPTQHSLAHQWNLGVWAQALDAQGQAPGGFAAFQVAHVPEPGTWLMLAGGLAALGLRATRRR